MRNIDNLFISKRFTNLISIFSFFMAFPCLEIFGFSFYFFIFYYIILTHLKFLNTFFKSSSFKKLLNILLFCVFISTIYNIVFRDSSIYLSSVGTSFRYIYWIHISVFFYSISKYINFNALSKWITIGFIVHIFCFYFFNFKIDLGFVEFDSAQSRNALVYCSLIFSGFVFYYVKNNHSNKYWLLSIFFLVAMLFTNGRSGATLAFFLVFCYHLLFNQKLYAFFKYVVISLFIFLFLSSSNSNQILILPSYFEDISPRFYNLITQQGDGDLEHDKSWLERQLMLEKTKEIFNDYPLLGIGANNFKNYNSKLKAFSNPRFERLYKYDISYLNTRSAHNSYANHLAEFGILGALLLAIILFPFVKFFNLMLFKPKIISKTPVFLIAIGFIGSLLHSIVIASFTGANFWFVLGVSYCIIEKFRHVK